MKVLLPVLLLLVGVLLYVTLGPKPAPSPTPTPVGEQSKLPWDQPAPAGTEPVANGDVRLHVSAERRNENGRINLDFHVTEEHGYMVDGVRLYFWYRFKDEDSGEWVDDALRIDHLIRDRLGCNETLVASTIILDAEYRDRGIDLAATTSENWGVQVIGFARAMRCTP